MLSGHIALLSWWPQCVFNHYSLEQFYVQLRGIRSALGHDLVDQVPDFGPSGVGYCPPVRGARL